MTDPFLIGKVQRLRGESQAMLRLEHKVQSVLQVYLGHTSVDIQVQQIDIRVEFLQPLFDPFRHDMVGDTTERLYANNLGNPLPGKCATSAANIQPSPN